MTFVVTLKGYQPSERYDGKPWTSARIEESAVHAGPFVAIDALALSPLDADATRPQVRNFTTEHATLATGWYRVVFIDETGEEDPVEPVFHGPTPRPTVADLGGLMRARTRDADTGEELGTFTSATSPTAMEAESIIDRAVALVSGRLGKVPVQLDEMGRTIVALRAAMLVETSYKPEEHDPEVSAYGAYREQYRDALEDYDAAVRGLVGETRQPRVYGVRMGTALTATD